MILEMVMKRRIGGYKGIDWGIAERAKSQNTQLEVSMGS